MLAPPDSPSLVVFTFEPLMSTLYASELTELLKKMLARGLGIGVKQCLAGWVQRDAEAWEAHYGAQWPLIRKAKRRYDPHGV